jgi:hypothetical protein
MRAGEEEELLFKRVLEKKEIELNRQKYNKIFFPNWSTFFRKNIY